MAKDGIQTLSRADADAAREVARKKKEAHAAKERVRYQQRKLAREAVKKAGMNPDDVDLTIEQRIRAAEAVEKKPGLTGKALAAWIMDGKTVSDTIREERAKAPRAAPAGERAPRAPKDPEAAAFALACKGMADLKSKFPASQARVFLDLVVQRNEGDTIYAKRKDQPLSAEVALPVVALRQFSIHGTPDPEIRKALTILGEGQKALWGRKLGLFLLHAYAQREV